MKTFEQLTEAEKFKVKSYFVLIQDIIGYVSSVVSEEYLNFISVFIDTFQIDDNNLRTQRKTVLGSCVCCGIPAIQTINNQDYCQICIDRGHFKE